MKQHQRWESRAAEAEWLWPALCIGGLWLCGLLLGLVWLMTWFGAVVIALTALVMWAVARRRSLLSAAWVGGACFTTAWVVVWLSLLFFFRLY
jgi:hypothetical protein